jgi:hypothetical protein
MTATGDHSAATWLRTRSVPAENGFHGLFVKVQQVR